MSLEGPGPRSSQDPAKRWNASTRAPPGSVAGTAPRWTPQYAQRRPTSLGRHSTCPPSGWGCRLQLAAIKGVTVWQQDHCSMAIACQKHFFICRMTYLQRFFHGVFAWSFEQSWTIPPESMVSLQFPPRPRTLLGVDGITSTLWGILENWPFFNRDKRPKKGGKRQHTQKKHTAPED